MSDDNATLAYPEPQRAHPTLVIPDDAVGTPARRRGRRRWPWVVGGALVLLIAAAVAGELIARAVLPGVVRAVVIEELGLPDDQPLDVAADGLLLPQLIAGRLDHLHLSADAVTLQDVTGAVEADVSGVPLHGGDLGAVTGTVTIDESQFTTLLDRGDLPVDGVEFDAPDAIVSASIPVLGLDVPVTVTVTPGILDGDVSLTPRSVSVGGLVIEADQVASMLGPLGARLTETQRICVADRLPAAVSLTALSITGSHAVVDLAVDGAIASDETLQHPGTCAAR
ncbi:LmeA family phospholipid-binding protein [Microbacterium sp. XT11]|uniref:LmeA family phospholipid-binding protein n=1 Tax=Microbacterium sp. XT11 TaxID=367477 RepID=UPI0007430A28|nr:DUF2993 domain-containing protein [Microbacterium sp. XT11]ALX66744.1 hypothetical protein AB663_002110 [Microbacterium sp. XT11]